MLECPVQVLLSTKQHTVEPQWLEHLWDHGNSFEMGSSSQCELIIAPVQEANSDDLGKIFSIFYTVIVC